MVANMTPTATQMSNYELPPIIPPVFRVVVRTLKSGVGNIQYFEETTACVVHSRKRVHEVIVEYVKDPTVQLRIESENRIVAIGVHGALLWLDKVPPPNYWLNPKTRPAPQTQQQRTMAACGLPIPTAYLEPIPCCP